MTEKQYNTLKEHDEVFDLVLNHNYLPSSENGRLQVIHNVYKEIFGIYVSTSCSSCIQDMVKMMNILKLEYENQNNQTQQTTINDGEQKSKRKRRTNR